MKAFFHMIQLRGINPIVLLARVDEAIPELRAQPDMKPVFAGAGAAFSGGRRGEASRALSSTQESYCAASPCRCEAEAPSASCSFWAMRWRRSSIALS